jgi:hypothetical protein
MPTTLPSVHVPRPGAAVPARVVRAPREHGPAAAVHGGAAAAPAPPRPARGDDVVAALARPAHELGRRRAGQEDGHVGAAAAGEAAAAGQELAAGDLAVADAAAGVALAHAEAGLGGLLDGALEEVWGCTCFVDDVARLYDALGEGGGGGRGEDGGEELHFG